MTAERNALSRRSFLAGTAACTAACGLGLLPSMASAAEAAAKKGGNMLIIYFSHSGNTKAVAEMIQKKTGADIIELKTVTPYPKDYNAVVEMAEKEKKSNARPAIATELPNLDKYDTIFLGYPNWWGTIPMAYCTLLEKYDLGSRIVIPFVTHGGSAFGSSLKDLKRLCPKARFKDGFEVKGSRAASSQAAVDKWLSKLGLAAE